jgi:L,D-transpeptidase catalytic domain
MNSPLIESFKGLPLGDLVQNQLLNVQSNSYNFKYERKNTMKKLLILFLFLNCCGIVWPFYWIFPPSNNEQFGSHAWLQRQMSILKSQTSNIEQNVLRLSLIAYAKARKSGIDNKQLLTVIDYSKPSTEKRLWVFDLKHNRTLYNTWVSHGKNSGGLTPTRFSNNFGSLKSSIGVFTTDYAPYVGGNGYSLRLNGLEPGINSNAYRRSVVVHGAWYVNSATIRRYGQLGRSWGCPAVSSDLAKPIIDTIKNRTLLFVYYPDRNWLSRSRFLT